MLNMLFVIILCYLVNVKATKTALHVVRADRMFNKTAKFMS